MTESNRLSSLADLGLLDTLPTEEYEQVVRLAAVICSTPICLISLVDEERQWFLAKVGMEARETPRSVSFCAHTIQQPGMMVVEDASLDRRFSSNDLVTGDPGIRFYAGMPLHAPDGQPLGTLCVIDTVPRTLSEGQRDALRILTLQVEARFELRAKQKALEATLAEKAVIAARLEESNRLFHAFMNRGPFLSYMKDAEGRYLYYNMPTAKHFGVDQTVWLGRTDEELWDQPLAAEYRKHDIEAISSGKTIEVAEVSGSGDAITHWKSFKFPFGCGEGGAILAGLSIDVTADLKREQALEATLRTNVELLHRLENSEALFRTFMDFIPLHAFLKSADGRYLFYNRYFAEQLGIDQAAWIGKTDFEVMPVDVAEHFRQTDLQVLKQDQHLELYDELPDQAGTMRRLRGLKFSYRNGKGEKTIGGIVIDMTDLLTYKEKLEAANHQLEQLATTDPLTGLRNRRVFEERAEIEFQVARRRKQPLSMLTLDIDNFKKRNDSFGHAVGDQALKNLGDILQGMCRVGDLSARIGGEEFALLLPDTCGEDAMSVAERIHVRLRELPQGKLPLTASIGVASIHPSTSGWRRLLACADDAMYVAKMSGKNRTVLHHDHMAALLKDAREAAAGAREAGLKPDIFSIAQASAPPPAGAGTVCDESPHA